MSKQENKGINWSLVIAFVALVGTALAIALSGQAMTTVNEIDDKEPPETYNWRATGNGTMIKWLNENFVSENQFNTHNTALKKVFTNLDEKVDGIQGSVTILEAQDDFTTQPTPQPPKISTVDLSLTVTDHKGNFKPSGYPRDVSAILIQGQSAFLDKSYLITIQGPSGNFVKDKFGDTLSDGDISEAWIPPATALPGEYEVVVTINSQKDSIKFILL